MKVHKNITIQIVLYEEDQDTVFKCLNNLKNFKVIILDNSNNSELKKKVLEKFKIYKYFLENKNLGYSKGHNKIAEFTDSEFLLILNADCLIDEENIVNLYNSFNNHINCGIVAPTTFDNNNKRTLNGSYLPENGDRDRIVNIEGDVCFQAVLGSAIFIKRSEFINVGKFDEQLFLFFSDYDLCRKIKKLKKSVIQTYFSKAIHSHGTSKVKNFFKRIYLREFFITYDELIYYYISNNYQLKYNILRKKINNYYYKLFISIIILNFKNIVFYFSKILAFYKFRKKIYN